MCVSSHTRSSGKCSSLTSRGEVGCTRVTHSFGLRSVVKPSSSRFSSKQATWCHRSWGPYIFAFRPSKSFFEIRTSPCQVPTPDCTYAVKYMSISLDLPQDQPLCWGHIYIIQIYYNLRTYNSVSFAWMGMKCWMWFSGPIDRVHRFRLFKIHLGDGELAGGLNISKGCMKSSRTGPEAEFNVFLYRHKDNLMP